MAPPLDRMVERPELGSQLVAALIEPEVGEVGLTTGLQGAGGFGKTTLAAWVCHQPEIDRHFPGGLLWVTVGQETHGADLAEKINDAAFVVSGRRPMIGDPDAAGAELGRLLQTREPALLVIDDVWTESQLRPFRFGAPACTRLATTRIPDLLPVTARRVRVDAMSGDQARELVADGVAGLDQGTADRLATVAGRWPVLLSLINGALRRRVMRGEPPRDAVDEISRQLVADGPTALDPARPDDRSRAVAATVAASLDLLEPADRQRFLDLGIFPEDVDIPLDVLRLLWPGRRVEALGEELVGLGLVAEYRLGPPGPRLVVHDVMRAYLHARVPAEDRTAAHGRMTAAARRLLARDDGDSAPTPWWTLPDDADYLWRHLPLHLHQAGCHDEVADLVTDLRWIEAKARRLGSVVGVDADLALVDTPAAAALRPALRDAAHLLGPIDPPEALGATLACALHGVPRLEATLARYRRTLVRPRLEPVWSLSGRQATTVPDELSVGHAGSVTSCAFSPDGALLATVADDAAVLVWEVPQGTRRRRLTGHTGGVWDCAFSPNGQLLATVGADGTARLWTSADGAASGVLRHSDQLTSCAFSPDGALLAATSTDGSARLWNVADRAPIRAVAGHPDGAWGCAFSPDGALLATTGTDGTARLWNVADGTLARAMTDHRGRVTSCAFSPDGTLLATTSTDGSARLWNVADGLLARAMADQEGSVRRCAFSPDGDLLALVGSGGVVKLWSVATGQPHRVLAGHVGMVLGCAFSPDGVVLATGSVDQTVRLWRLDDRSQSKVLTGTTGRVYRCAFSPDGGLLATPSINGPTRLWNMTDRTVHAELSADAGGLRSCVFSPDGTLVASGGNDGVVRLWDVATGVMRATLVGHTHWVAACSFSPDGALLASAGYDATVRLWEVAAGCERKVLLSPFRYVHDCAFSPDGTLLATSGNDGTVPIWDVATGELHTTLIGHADMVNRTAFSPDGALLASVSDDTTLRLWDMPHGTPRAVFTGHTSWTEVCAFSADGALLASAGQDGTVRLWRPSGEGCHCALRVGGHLGGLAWHPDGTTLCAAGGGGIHLLRYQP